MEEKERDLDDDDRALIERQMAAERYAQEQSQQQNIATDTSESDQGRKARKPNWELLKEAREADEAEGSPLARGFGKAEEKGGADKQHAKLATAFQNSAMVKMAQLPKIDSVQKLEKLKESLVERAATGVALDSARPAPPPPPRAAPGTALAFLNAAQDPGYYIRERPQREGGQGQDGEEQQAPDEEEQALAKACEEAEAEIKAKAIVGVSRVYAANDHEDKPVVVIETARGLGYTGLAAIPDKVGEFETITRIYYPNLPLKRDRPLV